MTELDEPERGVGAALVLSGWLLSNRGVSCERAREGGWKLRNRHGKSMQVNLEANMGTDACRLPLVTRKKG